MGEDLQTCRPVIGWFLARIPKARTSHELDPWAHITSELGLKAFVRRVMSSAANLTAKNFYVFNAICSAAVCHFPHLFKPLQSAEVYSRCQSLVPTSQKTVCNH
jgi:hypothetical protein